MGRHGGAVATELSESGKCACLVAAACKRRAGWVFVGMARAGKLAAASAVLCLASARHSRVSRAGLGRHQTTDHLTISMHSMNLRKVVHRAYNGVVTKRNC